MFTALPVITISGLLVLLVAWLVYQHLQALKQTRKRDPIVSSFQPDKRLEAFKNDLQKEAELSKPAKPLEKSAEAEAVEYLSKLMRQVYNSTMDLVSQYSLRTKPWDKIRKIAKADYLLFYDYIAEAGLYLPKDITSKVNKLSSELYWILWQCLDTSNPTKDDLELADERMRSAIPHLIGDIQDGLNRLLISKASQDATVQSAGDEQPELTRE
jgi:hypothetical protein